MRWKNNRTKKETWVISKTSSRTTTWSYKLQFLNQFLLKTELSAQADSSIPSKSKQSTLFVINKSRGVFDPHIALLNAWRRSTVLKRIQDFRNPLQSGDYRYLTERKGYLRMPALSNNQQKIVGDFENLCIFPHCTKALTRKHIKIKCPNLC